jgi:hypothetical protein
MITVIFDSRSNYAAIPPLALRGAWEEGVVARHIAAHLKQRDRKDFTIARQPGSRGGLVVLRRGKAEIPFKIEGSARTPDGHPPTDPRAVVPPVWGRK